MRMKEHPYIRIMRRLEEAENLLSLYYEGAPGTVGEMGWDVFRDQVRLFLDDEMASPTWPEVVGAARDMAAHRKADTHAKVAEEEHW